MPPTIGAAEVARLLGRSTDWLYRNYAMLQSRDGFPPPILRHGELAWATVHLHAWLDRQLPACLQEAVRAIRLAEAALAETDQQHEIDAWRDRLARRFVPRGNRDHKET